MADDADVLSAAGVKKRALRVLLHNSEGVAPGAAAPLVVKEYAPLAADWATGATPVTVTAANQALAAATASLKNVVTWMIITCGSTWTANTLQIQNGTTVVLELDLPAGAGVYNLPNFLSPGALATAVNAALNVKATGAVTGTCKVNAGGYRTA